MAQGQKDSRRAKISTEFLARLDRLEAQETVRAILLLRGKDSEETLAQRQSRRNRRSAVEAIRKAAARALPEIDSILELFGGQRLASSLDVLGSIPIETTAAGIRALAASGYVKAILEDQPITLTS